MWAVVLAATATATTAVVLLQQLLELELELELVVVVLVVLVVMGALLVVLMAVVAGAPGELYGFPCHVKAARFIWPSSPLSL